MGIPHFYGDKMLILITYDVNTETKEGKTRLRKVSKTCKNYGQRVQNSVFECNVDASQYLVLKKDLGKIIDKSTDSLRFYNLGNHYNSRIEHIGTKESYDAEGILLL